MAACSSSSSGSLPRPLVVGSCSSLLSDDCSASACLSLSLSACLALASLALAFSFCLAFLLLAAGCSPPFLPATAAVLAALALLALALLEGPSSMNMSSSSTERVSSILARSSAALRSSAFRVCSSLRFLANNRFRSRMRGSSMRFFTGSSFSSSDRSSGKLNASLISSGDLPSINLANALDAMSTNGRISRLSAADVSSHSFFVSILTNFSSNSLRSLSERSRAA
mmetsp:Transcript_25845/g.65739  ORF Transcript_25845/g.65739 Transcript_25845/m.65739 type:complete len:226 (-) Transcript_25845:302-979(-)